MYANLRLRAAVRLAGLRPHADNPALRAWRSHKKPPAEAGGLRVASLPACHAKRVRTGKLRAVIRHGRRGGFRARSPRVSTRGFLCGCQARRAGLIPSGRRPAKRTAARGRGFACSMPPGFHPGLLVWVPGPEGRVDSKRAQARQANRGTRPRVCVQHAPGFSPGASWATRAIHTKSPRRKPGDSGSHPFPLAMRSGFEPGNCVPSSGMDGGVVFVPGFPGFPPGASWAAEETESQFKGSAKQRSQPD